MIEKKNVKKLAWVAVALVIMVLSMTVVSKAASNPENHKKTIEALDEKKADILKHQRQHQQPLRQFPEMRQHR